MPPKRKSNVKVPANPDGGPPMPGDVDVNFTGKLPSPQKFVSATAPKPPEAEAQAAEPTVAVNKFNGEFKKGVYRTCADSMICITEVQAQACIVRKGILNDGQLDWGAPYSMAKVNLVKLLTLKQEG